MSQHELSLGEAFQSPLTSAAELKTIAREATAAGRTDIALAAGRERIARLADEDGERMFAREVRAGCWDHRSDVQRASRGETL
jgi:hypothetical protein